MAEVLLASEGKCLLIRNFTLLVHVCEVSHQVDDNAIACMIAHFTEPLRLNILKALHARDVEHEEHAARALVEIACD